MTTTCDGATKLLPAQSLSRHDGLGLIILDFPLLTSLGVTHMHTKWVFYYDKPTWRSAWIVNQAYLVINYPLTPTSTESRRDNKAKDFPLQIHIFNNHPLPQHISQALMKPHNKVLFHFSQVLTLRLQKEVLEARKNKYEIDKNTNEELELSVTRNENEPK